MAVNMVIIEGFITDLKPARFSAEGKKVLSFTVCTKETIGKSDIKEYHRVVIFEPLSSRLELSVRQHVGITGRLGTRKWTDKDNIDRYVTEIIANSCVAGPVWESREERPADASSPAHRPDPQQQAASETSLADLPV